MALAITIQHEYTASILAVVLTLGCNIRYLFDPITIRLSSDPAVNNDHGGHSGCFLTQVFVNVLICVRQAVGESLWFRNRVVG